MQTPALLVLALQMKETAVTKKIQGSHHIMKIIKRVSSNFSCHKVPRQKEGVMNLGFNEQFGPAGDGTSR